MIRSGCPETEKAGSVIFSPGFQPILFFSFSFFLQFCFLPILFFCDFFRLCFLPVFLLLFFVYVFCCPFFACVFLLPVFRLCFFVDCFRLCFLTVFCFYISVIVILRMRLRRAGAGKKEGLCPGDPGRGLKASRSGQDHSLFCL